MSDNKTTRSLSRSGNSFQDGLRQLRFTLRDPVLLVSIVSILIVVLLFIIFPLFSILKESVYYQDS
ncbi:MAG: hypothetical protein K9L21_04285, partial [Spirochaetia bacterium]|nr:hypothetical protein [Spirochaetia bacterium]